MGHAVALQKAQVCARIAGTGNCHHGRLAHGYGFSCSFIAGIVVTAATGLARRAVGAKRVPVRIGTGRYYVYTLAMCFYCVGFFTYRSAREPPGRLRLHLQAYPKLPNASTCQPGCNESMPWAEDDADVHADQKQLIQGMNHGCGSLPFRQKRRGQNSRREGHEKTDG